LREAVDERHRQLATETAELADSLAGIELELAAVFHSLAARGAVPAPRTPEQPGRRG